MNKKKAQVNKVFVFAISLIVIGFVVLLAGKFIGSFANDSENKIDVDFLNDIKNDYTKTLKSYSSEREGKYRLTNKINLVCFTPKSQDRDKCIEDLKISKDNVSGYDKTSLETVMQDNNMILYSKDDIAYQNNLGEYNVDKCFCAKPKAGKIQLFFQNIKHEVMIMDLNEFKNFE